MSTLNVDTLANELGTGGPDFVGMPTVQGDPIVESGSNSDGTWARWADGSQMCRQNNFPLSEVLGNAGYWTFPNNFATGSFPTCSGNASSRSDTVGERADSVGFGAAGVYSAVNTRVAVYHGQAGERSAPFRSTLIAFGRWK